jgi:hypothetical protein
MKGRRISDGHFCIEIYWEKRRANKVHFIIFGCSGQQSVDLFFLFQPFPSAHKIYILKAETNFPESKWCVNNPEEEKHILPNPM